MGDFITLLATKFAEWLVGAAAVSKGTFAAKAAIWAAKTVIVGVPLLMAGKALLPKMDLNSLLARSSMQRNPISSRKVVYGRAKVGGTILYMSEGTSGVAANREHLYMVTALSYKEIDSFEKIYANNEELTIDGSTGHVTSPSRYYPNSNPRFTFGVSSVMTGTTTQTLDTAVSSNTDLTSSDQFKGIACLQFWMAYDPEVFTSGIPNVTALVKGRKVLDFRTSTTAWSDNPALIIYDYLTDTDYGLGVPVSRIDTTSFTAAANTCEEQVALDTDPVTYENRYTCNGVIDTAATIANNLEMLLSSCVGNLSYVDGKYKLRVGEWVAPTQTITEEDLRGAVSLITKPSRREVFNTVKGIIVTEASNWQPADYPEVKNTAAITAAGEEIKSELPLPFTSSSSMAQRIAKIYLNKNLQDYTLTLPLKLSQFSLEPNDTVNVTLEKSFGFKNKIFEVVEWKFGTSNGENGELVLGVDVTLRETASSVYSWAATDETAMPETTAPTITKIENVDAPSFSLAAITTKKADDGTLIDGVECNITDPTDNRHVVEYDVAYKKSSDSNFTEISVLRDSN